MPSIKRGNPFDISFPPFDYAANTDVKMSRQNVWAEINNIRQCWFHPFEFHPGVRN